MVRVAVFSVFNFYFQNLTKNLAAHQLERSHKAIIKMASAVPSIVGSFVE